MAYLQHDNKLVLLKKCIKTNKNLQTFSITCINICSYTNCNDKEKNADEYKNRFRYAFSCNH